MDKKHGWLFVALIAALVLIPAAAQAKVAADKLEAANAERAQAIADFKARAPGCASTASHPCEEFIHEKPVPPNEVLINETDFTSESVPNGTKYTATTATVVTVIKGSETEHIFLEEGEWVVDYSGHPTEPRWLIWVCITT